MLARRLVHGSAALAALGVLLVIVLGVVTARDDGEPTGPGPQVRSSAAVAALAQWDARRARAWAAGDIGALRSLYVDGSRSGHQDAAMLQAWVDRGLRVRGLETQVLRVDVLRHDEHVWVLAVTDRVRGGVAVGDGREIGLPADRASARRITLRLVAGRWLVEEVRS